MNDGLAVFLMSLGVLIFIGFLSNVSDAIRKDTKPNTKPNTKPSTKPNVTPDNQPDFSTIHTMQGFTFTCAANQRLFIALIAVALMGLFIGSFYVFDDYSRYSTKLIWAFMGGAIASPLVLFGVWHLSLTLAIAKTSALFLNNK